MPPDAEYPTLRPQAQEVEEPTSPTEPSFHNNDLFATIQATHASLADALAKIAANLESNAARLDNMEIQRRNRSAKASGNATAALTPLVKTKAGFGPTSMTGMTSNFPLASVGAPYPTPFPATVGDAEAMNPLDIVILTSWGNDDFGVVHGDSLADCKRKFLLFVYGE